MSTIILASIFLAFLPAASLIGIVHLLGRPDRREDRE